MGWFGSGKGRSKAYLKAGRLEDVMALIQVLGLDPYAHRGEKQLNEELRGKPASAGSWVELAKTHPEFFRVYEGDGGATASLVARHVLGSTPESKQFSREFVAGLIAAAIQIHDGQLRRRQVLRAAWIGGAVLLLTALASVASSAVTIVQHFQK